MIREIANPDAIQLKAPAFVCDKPLSPHIPKPFPNQHSFIVLCGASRSGKTSMMINMLTNRELYCRVFENVFVVMPASSTASMRSNIFDGIDQHKKFDDLTPETLDSIIAQLEAYSEMSENSLIVFDDVTASLKNKFVQRGLARIIANRRHLKCTILLAVQWYNSIPLNIRKQINVLIMFAPKNFKEVKNIAEELTKYEDNEFKKICDYVFDAKYNWMLINRDDNQIYKMFNLLEIVDK